MLWHLLWALAAGPVVVLAAVLGSIAVVDGRAVLGGVGAAVVLLAVAAVAIGPRLRYRSWRWQLTDEGLEMGHGVLLRTESAIPVFRVQQIDVRQGPLERLFGIVTLQVSTASSGSDGVLPGLDAARADEVRRDLLGRLGTDDGV